ncbi:signal recognition particle subunit srp19 [Cladorrhinum samala]|uniref:Signal recognition particle subunit srp19 n=1 Tax=Cladorrhinum samala TaxID=585594 RepID=A0AAV9H982_9PEZI|nr:signal recognition particle subunit srp19 [Cladorrhinum samala]
MSHPRIEEVSESDSNPDLSDPSEDDIDDFVESDIMRARTGPAASSSQRQQQQQQQQRQQQSSSSSPADFLPPLPQPAGYPQMPTTTDSSAYKSFLCLYPIYFSSLHTRAQGRRVPASLAVPNPLATEIVHACSNLRLPTVLEAGKLHPKDWANPGRVKIDLSNHRQVIKNKHHLYILIAKHLKANPVTEDSNALRVMVRGVPPPPAKGEKWPRPAVPRGWKMSELLPHYSPAMTGGGVSENFLKDMMSQMGGAGGPGGAGGAGGMDMASLMQSMAGGMGGGGPGGGMDMASLMQSMGMGGGMGGAGPSSPAGGKKKGKK